MTGQKVSAAIRLPNHPLAPRLKQALLAIDGVHDDGKLPGTPVTICAPGQIVGAGDYSETADGEPRITLAQDADHPALSLVHEVGHLLDRYGIGVPMTTASVESFALAPWRDAVGASPTIGLLRSYFTRTKVSVTRGGRQQMVDVPLRYVVYLVSYPEVFARSYAQYIALRAGDVLREALDEARRAEWQDHEMPLPRFWRDEEFVPIARELDKLLERLAWRL